MPPTNPARRRALTDAAIALLGEAGVHGVTHRAVEKAAGLPPGTASNYFRSREALLIGAARRIVELHHADMDAAGRRMEGADVRAGLAERLTGMLTESLLTAATVLRARYQAIFELQLEAARSPALAEALAGLHDGSVRRLAAGHDAAPGPQFPAEAIPTVMALYGGALFTLVTAPAGQVGREFAHGLARAIVRGALAGPAS